MISEPPRGMASRALMQRFITTCSTCVGSARTTARSLARVALISMLLPITFSPRLRVSMTGLVQIHVVGFQYLLARDGQ